MWDTLNIYIKFCKKAAIKALGSENIMVKLLTPEDYLPTIKVLHEKYTEYYMYKPKKSINI